MTSFDEVYSAFRDKIFDVDLALFTDIEEREILYGYMKWAVAKFKRCCKKLDSMDNTTQAFSEDLTEEEINILSELMVENWAKPKLYNGENLRNALNTKDYSFFSPANLLSEIRELYYLAKKNAATMMNEYSILNGNFSELKTRGV